MKTKKINILLAIVVILVTTYSCKKIDVPNFNTVSVVLTNKGSGYLTDNTILNPSTAFSLNFTITCPTDMEYVYISKNGTVVSTDQLTTSKTSFTGDKSFTADASPGVYDYRIFAKDKAGKYLGEKNIVVTITSDFNYYTVKTISVPDTTAKTNPTYYSSSQNQVFSYTNASANSANIDFGYFFDPALTGTVVNGHTLYALNVTPVPSPIAMYDISAFTKNATQLKIITTPAFTAITSNASLAALGTTLSSGTSTSVKGLKTGTLVAFKTASGKIGVLSVNYTNQDQPWKSTFMNFDVKVQK